MNAKKFSDAMSELDSKYIDEALSYKKKAKQKEKKPILIKCGAIAACLMLVIGYVLLSPTTYNGRLVINEYHTNSTDSYYSSPASGEVDFTYEVREALEKYKGKNVIFLLTFDLFKDGGITDEERNEEYQRLVSLGYKLYSAKCWTYQGEGEKQYYTVVVGYFTESDLSQFKNNSEYGYMFDFATNGDGSGISVNEDEIITSFPIDFS